MCLFHCSEIAALRLSRSQAATSYNLDSDRYRLEDMFLRAAWDSWEAREREAMRKELEAKFCAAQARLRLSPETLCRRMPRSLRSIPGILASQRGRGLASSCLQGM